GGVGRVYFYPGGVRVNVGCVRGITYRVNGKFYSSDAPPAIINYQLSGGVGRVYLYPGGVRVNVGCVRRIT
ncbi:MAG: hypothetical protein KFF72_08070, partial [Arthrospira sp. SH-MAG29]